jgi:hypothetical protein
MFPTIVPAREHYEFFLGSLPALEEEPHERQEIQRRKGRRFAKIESLPA